MIRELRLSPPNKEYITKIFWHDKIRKERDDHRAKIVSTQVLLESCKLPLSNKGLL